MARESVEQEWERIKIKQFFDALNQLTRKTGIAIGGCKCCGSPWAYVLKPEESKGSYRYVSDATDTEGWRENINWTDEPEEGI